MNGSKRNEMEGILLFEEMRHHQQQREHRAHRRGDACAHDPHIQRKHEEIIAEHVEHAAEQHRFRCQRRVAVIAEKRGQELCEQEAGHNEFNGEHIPLCQRQQSLFCAEQRQQRTVKKR